MHSEQWKSSIPSEVHASYVFAKKNGNGQRALTNREITQKENVWDCGREY